MRILAATDYSENSKSAIKFAIQLAEQNPDVKVSFFHSLHIPQPTNLSDADFAQFEIEKIEEGKQNLKLFIDDIYKSLNLAPKDNELVVIESSIADGNIINLAEKEKYDFICIGARGAGKLEKFLGTNTVNIINKSKVPVLAIPINYTFGQINKIMYASDFTDVDAELTKVLDFDKKLNAEIEIIHFAFPSETAQKESQALRIKQEYSQNIKVTVVDNNALKPVVANINDYVTQHLPSLLVMFTDPNKSFIEKLIFSGNTEGMALKANVPLLVFKKAN